MPTIDIGTARLGMTVAERFRRKRKMTSTTRKIASSSVNLTSFTDSRMEMDRSYSIVRCMAGGMIGTKSRQELEDTVYHRDGVGPGLPLNGEDDARFAVDPTREAVILHAVGDRGHLVQPHGRAVAIRHDQRAIERSVGELPVRLDIEGSCALHRACPWAC